MRPTNFLTAWGKILRGRIPLLSIEITRECPLSCPGCYAYGESHLADGAKLVDLTDSKGDELVANILRLVDEHQPVQVSQQLGGQRSQEGLGSFIERVPCLVEIGLVEHGG